MARYTYGGRLEQVGVEVAANLSLKLKPNDFLPDLYDKPVTDVTRVVVTDFLIDSVAATTIPTDDAGIPVYFEGPDNIRPLYDEAGHRLNPNDNLGDTVVPAATEAVAGISEISSNTEADGGTDNITQMTPVKVKRRIDAHNADVASHNDIRTVVDETAAALGNKADLISGEVPLDQLPQSDGPTGSMLALRRATGGLAVATASFDDEAVTKLQMEAAITAGAGSGADVRDLPSTATPGAPLAATGTGTWVAVAGMAVTDAASGEKWKLSGSLPFRSTAVAGVKVRFKIGAAAVTNQLLNPEAATNTANWTISNPHTLTRGTAFTNQQGGTGYFLATAASTATMQNFSETKPTTPGVPWSAGAYSRLVTGTAKTMRADVQYLDAAGAPLRSFLGTQVTPAGGSWTRSLATNDTLGGPDGTTQVRVRVVYVTPAVTDAVAFGSVQLEAASALPAYGSTGGSGSTAYTIEGDFRGPVVTTPTADSYGRVIPIEYPTDSNLTAAFGGLGATTTGRIAFDFDVTVGGTGLTGQRIEFEFADNATDGANHATIRGGTATFARVV